MHPRRRGGAAPRRIPHALIVSMALAVSGFLPAAAPAAAKPSPADSQAAPLQALAANQVRLQFITGGLSSPTGVTNAGDGSGRLFVTEREGRIRVVKDGAVQSGYFLDFADEVQGGGEEGLLGLAFHPDFASNHLLYVYFTDNAGNNMVREYETNASAAAVDESTARNLLPLAHPTNNNHNGGALAFGLDGYLYIGVGDGGGGGDPFESGQDKNDLRGKILRIDVDGTGAGTYGRYAIPADNPFFGTSGAKGEVWAWGMRNPWRISFDRATDDLWIGDVGQGAYEEIDHELASSAGGVNYGWDCREGKHVFSDPSPGLGCGGPFTDPIAEYTHVSGNCSVTGGFVYRGSTQPDLVGQYVLADYCSGRIWTIPAAGTTLTQRLQVGINISSFGESESGELYATDLTGGRLYRVVAPPFSDVTQSLFLDDINWIYYAGITSGCGGVKYCPTEHVTREQMASFLVRALGLPGTSTDFFTDDESSPHESDINRLAAAGITTGCTATTFCPTERVRREQMASFLARALDLPATGNDYFTDDETSIHEQNINRVRAAGITTGCTATTFCPKNFVTREQMAAFLHRALD
jgi:glucose/arabinose dehydrogenase